MDLRRLSSFLAVVDEGSFTRAARLLGISQPSLSQQIRTLESELGGPLLERLPRGIRLTPAGRALLPEAQAAVRAAERAGNAARMALGLEAGELEVATLLSMAVGILPRAIASWIERHPGIGIRMREYTHRALLEEDVRSRRRRHRARPGAGGLAGAAGAARLRGARRRPAARPTRSPARARRRSRRSPTGSGSSSSPATA